MATKQQIEQFRRRVEESKRQDEIEERETGHPSLLRVELAMRKFHGMPQHIVEMVMNELYPDVTRAFAIKVVEAMIDTSETVEVAALKLNPQRIEWLKRWAERQPESLSIEIQESREPYELFTKSGQKAISNAKAEGLIVETESGYNWIGTKVLLSYFCGRVICGDYINDGVFNSKPWYKGNKNFPANHVSALFTIKGKKATNVDGSRQDRISSQGTVPKGYEKVEKCLSGLF